MHMNPLCMSPLLSLSWMGLYGAGSPKASWLLGSPWAAYAWSHPDIVVCIQNSQVVIIHVVSQGNGFACWRTKWQRLKGMRSSTMQGMMWKWSTAIRIALDAYVCPGLGFFKTQNFDKLMQIKHKHTYIYIQREIYLYIYIYVYMHSGVVGHHWRDQLNTQMDLPPSLRTSMPKFLLLGNITLKIVKVWPHDVLIYNK